MFDGSNLNKLLPQNHTTNGSRDMVEEQQSYWVTRYIYESN